MALLSSLLLAGSAFLWVQQALEPRLPVYTLTLVPSWRYAAWPTVRLGGPQVEMRALAHIQLVHENILPLDMYALTFDLLYPRRITTGGIVVLEHLATLSDERQLHPFRRPTSSSSSSSSPQRTVSPTFAPGSDRAVAPSTSPSTSSSSSSSSLSSLSSSSSSSSSTISTSPGPGPADAEPLWSLKPQASFQAVTLMHMTAHLGAVLRVLPSLLFALAQSARWTGPPAAHIILPAVGAAQVQVPGLPLPLTLSLKCDHVWHLWTQQAVGTTCGLEQVQAGWRDLSQVVTELRQRVQQSPDDALHPTSGGFWPPASSSSTSSSSLWAKEEEEGEQEQGKEKEPEAAVNDSLPLSAPSSTPSSLPLVPSWQLWSFLWQQNSSQWLQDATLGSIA